MTNGDRGDDAGKARLPLVSVALMILFVVGGSLLVLVHWPPGPANLDWGVWILCYFGYVYLIGASIFYARTGR
jgi:hypothetical protein